jgi:hypothetical protein
MSQAMRSSRRPIQHCEIQWRALRIRVSYTPDWLSSEADRHHTAHIEIDSCDSQPHPISETGYRSLFVPGNAYADIDEVVHTVLTWLDRAALSREWKAFEAEQRQGRLF